MNSVTLSISPERKLAQRRGFTWLSKVVHEIITRHTPPKEEIPQQTILTIDEICKRVIDQVIADPSTNVREMLELISGDNTSQRSITKEEKHILAQLAYAIQQNIGNYGAVQNAKNPLGVRKVRAIHTGNAPGK